MSEELSIKQRTIFRFVYTKSKNAFLTYYKKSSKEYTKIDYSDISSKLIKNDVLGHEPSPLLINLDIHRRVNNAIEKPDISAILYKLDSIDEKNIIKVKKSISKAAIEELVFEIVLINYNDYDFSPSFIEGFSSIVSLHT